MPFFGARILAVLLCAAFLAGTVASAQAQGSNPDQKPPEQQKNQTGDAAKAEAEKKRSDEIAEAGRLLTGPAANPECIWLGWRVVRLLWRDDLDTAFRHLDLYDRFGCPGNHIQASFRCLVRTGPADPKAAEALDKAVRACWTNPALLPDPAAVAAPAPPTAQGGTTTR
jgi:Ni/Co efflux regulator RcnB